MIKKISSIYFSNSDIIYIDYRLFVSLFVSSDPTPTFVDSSGFTLARLDLTIIVGGTSGH